MWYLITKLFWYLLAALVIGPDSRMDDFKEKTGPFRSFKLELGR